MNLENRIRAFGLWKLNRLSISFVVLSLNGEELLMDGQELLHAISDMLDEKLDAGFGTVGKRLDGMDARLDKVEKRLDGVDARLDKVEKRLDGVDARLDRVEKRLDGMDARLDKVEKHQDKMELRLEKVESDVSALRYGQREIHRKLEDVSALVESTYKMALDAWGQSTENRKLLEAVSG